MYSILTKINEEMASLVKQTRRSLVRISDGHRTCAAGTVWHTQGLIVTNAHAIRGRHTEVSLRDGRLLPARILAFDQEYDLAALAVDAEGLNAIDLGDSTSVEVGQYVLAMGYPQGMDGVATSGIFMGEGADHMEISFAQDFLAVNVLLRPGNSGGPLLDMNGKLVGINTMMTGLNTGLAIPVNKAKAFLREKVGER